ncbi:thiamine-phosphate kinase [Henriciella aquimarina]|uniref:thiamine-phosphate kinase n=1 Tax=Henriciella aquimarina TaxID=545261 RepID=UPI000A028978|nr:thiamine-phosphate kinase [Henriciella aquimarina]
MSEFDWIDRYLKPIATSPNAMGLENDIAKLRREPAGQRIATMDTLVEGIHFLKSDPLETVARKLARVNVSDIICKGARPEEAFLSLALPDTFSEEDFAAFSGGLRKDLDQWDIDLLGGDIVRTSGPLVVTLFLTGLCHGPEPVSRANAAIGDVLMVTGQIGAGTAGLEHVRSRQQTALAEHYRVPNIPDIEIAAIISHYASASIDVSDGLISDAAHIAKSSDVSIAIDLGRVPWALSSPSLERMLALATGGDDYQTLFTVDRDRVSECHGALEKTGISATRIGEVVSGAGVSAYLEGEPVTLPAKSGYQH